MRLKYEPRGASRFRERRAQPERFEGRSPENQGQILALAVLGVPYLLDSGSRPQTLDPESATLNPQPQISVRAMVAEP